MQHDCFSLWDRVQRLCASHLQARQDVRRSILFDILLDWFAEIYSRKGKCIMGIGFRHVKSVLEQKFDRPDDATL